MNKKDLQNELLKSGFKQDLHGNFELELERKITVDIYASLFGKIKMIGLVYKFNKELDEVLHDEFWEKCNNFVNSQNNGVVLGSLSFDFVEADILDKNLLEKISGSEIRDMCANFLTSIKPLLEEYGL